MNGATQIYVSGREYKVPGDLVTYHQIVDIWNELHAPEGKHIIGTPGKDVQVKDGTSFSVDPEHVS